MDKLLLIGINTRSMVNSALKLNYEVFSTSYFSTSDFPTIKNSKSILHETENESTGEFDKEYNPLKLLEESEEYLDIVDYIIPISGVLASDFTGKYQKYQKKILGNLDIEKVENKYKFYKEIKKEFLTPETFHVKDIDEAIEIQKSSQDKQYIIKPNIGSGGYDTNLLDNELNFEENCSDCDWIVQEYVDGVTLSSSVLGIKNKAKNIINSRLLTSRDFGENNFKYVGNILPLDEKSILTKINKPINELLNEMKEISEELIRKFRLIGSNGVDFILNDKGLYVIEVNPRLQGTYECCQQALGINMLEAHIKACQNELIEIGKAEYYSYKKIIYAPTAVKYKKLELNNIYDTPYVGTITEKEEPLLTMIEKDKNFDKLNEKIKKTSEIIDKLN